MNDALVPLTEEHLGPAVDLFRSDDVVLRQNQRR